VLLALTIGTALERRRLRRSWRWIHRLNYLIFVAVLAHGWVLGFDFGAELWLRVWFLVCAAAVAAGLAYRLTASR
jgi:DMSO/TMAO reductase YedYZ heme-binding membrane subunit